MLTTAAHDPALASEILLDAQRKDGHARAWIKAVIAHERRDLNSWRVAEREIGPISVMTRTPISADAYVALAASSMRLLLEPRGSLGGYFILLDQLTLKQLKATKKRSEDVSGVLMRLAKVDAKERG
jgi:hypothetical protein